MSNKPEFIYYITCEMCISFRKLSIRVDFRRNQARTVASFIVMIVGGGQPLAKNLDKQKKKR